jgi:hypothetical protein
MNIFLYATKITREMLQGISSPSCDPTNRKRASMGTNTCKPRRDHSRALMSTRQPKYRRKTRKG